MSQTILLKWLFLPALCSPQSILNPSISNLNSKVSTRRENKFQQQISVVELTQWWGTINIGKSRINRFLKSYKPRRETFYKLTSHLGNLKVSWSTMYVWARWFSKSFFKFMAIQVSFSVTKTRRIVIALCYWCLYPPHARY